MQKLTERIRAVAFDLDGTLIDTMGDLAAAVNLMLSMLGAKELPQLRVRALVGNGVDQLVMRALNESVGSSATHAAQRSAALALFRRLYGQGLFKHSKVYPGVEQALRSLAEAGISLCCITNKDSVFAEPLLKQAALSGLLSFTLCADRAEDRKPSPNMLLAACSRFGIAPAEMLYVGDSSMDIAAARAAGSPVIAVSYGYGKDHAAGAADVQADGCVDDLTELVALCVRPPAEQPHLKLYTGAT
ncbi:MAG TPA: phosphoglycolate phosphatase [Steroidobacteraceae bacterium]|nr:phosphoglycolate phosphatase [Steroidobacteraceae bacterium]